MSFLRTFSVYFGSAYFALLAILLTPQAQNKFIYLSWARFPLFGDYDHVELYGTAPHQVRNFRLTTSDGVELGVHHSLPDSLYYSYLSENGMPTDENPIPDSYFDAALTSEEHPTILFLHGNGVTRLFAHRIGFMRQMSAIRSRFGKSKNEIGQDGLNYVTFDYRTYGDSSRHISPSEKGLLLDSRTVWNWIVEKGVKPSRINIVGHSLGCSVSAGLASELASENIHPHSLALVAPFQSVSKLLSTYKIAKVIPVVQPIYNVNPNFAKKLLDRFLVDTWDTENYLKNVKTKLLLVHSKDDTEIPNSHSMALFQDLISPLLPKLSLGDSDNPLKSMMALDKNELAKVAEEHKEYEAARKQIIHQFSDVNWSISRFARPDGYRKSGEAVWGEVLHLDLMTGGHNAVLTSALTVDWIRRLASDSTQI